MRGIQQFRISPWISTCPFSQVKAADLIGSSSMVLNLVNRFAIRESWIITMKLSVLTNLKFSPTFSPTVSPTRRWWYWLALQTPYFFSWVFSLGFSPVFSTVSPKFFSTVNGKSHWSAWNGSQCDIFLAQELQRRKSKLAEIKNQCKKQHTAEWTWFYFQNQSSLLRFVMRTVVCTWK